MPPNPKVEAFVARARSWKDETRRLREILLDCGLDEAIKWGKPTYLVDGTNIAIIQGFKDKCALMFFQGSLLKDPKHLLVSQGPHTQAALRLELCSVADVDKHEKALRGLVAQAVAFAKAGTRVALTRKHELVWPEELEAAFRREARLKKAFAALTPGRQRGYVMHFMGAKQSSTRAARVDRCAPKILAGKGFNEP